MAALMYFATPWSRTRRSLTRRDIQGRWTGTLLLCGIAGWGHQMPTPPFCGSCVCFCCVIFSLFLLLVCLFAGCCLYFVNAVVLNARLLHPCLFMQAREPETSTAVPGQQSNQRCLVPRGHQANGKIPEAFRGGPRRH